MASLVKRLGIFFFRISSLILFFYSPLFARPPRRSGTTFMVTSTQSLLINIAIGVFALITIVALVYVIKIKKKPATDDRYELGFGDTKTRTKKSPSAPSKRPSKSSRNDEPVLPSNALPGKPEKAMEGPPTDMVVTEKTRAQMMNMISSITAIKSIEKPAEPVKTEEDVKALESSELVEALANTLISVPVIENSEIGKFSKMTIDGSLLFDESDFV